LEIELPDGTVLDAPDGSNPRAIVAGYNRSKEAATLNAMPNIDKFGVGLARPIIRTTLGLKQLSGSPVNLDVDEQGGLVGTESGLPALSDTDRAVLQHLSDLKGGAATAGDIVGNTALLAVPGTAVGALGSVLPRTMAMRGLTMAGADAAANAGTAALAVPEPGRTRAGDAAVAAIGSGIGSGVGQLVKGAMPSTTLKSFLDFADSLGVKDLIGAGSALGALHTLGLSHVAAPIEGTVGAAYAAQKLARTKPVSNFLTGETAAQKYLKSNFPTALEYLSQVGAGAAEGTIQ
jgi:hypothetical protein